MAPFTMADVSKAIAGSEVAMLSTRARNGYVAARPMSHNGEVEYEGDNFFFAYESSHTVADIKLDPRIGLTFVGIKGVAGKRVYVSIEAHAELIRDKVQFTQHWSRGVEEWADQGIETPGLVLIKACAVRIHYWSGNEQYDVALGEVCK